MDGGGVGREKEGGCVHGRKRERAYDWLVGWFTQAAMVSREMARSDIIPSSRETKEGPAQWGDGCGVNV